MRRRSFPSCSRVARPWQRGRDRVRQLRPRRARSSRPRSALPSVNHSFGAMIPLARAERAEESWRRCGEATGSSPTRTRAPSAGSSSTSRRRASPGSSRSARSSGCGPCPTPPGRSPAWLDELERPLVYVTMGTVCNRPELFRPLLDGLDGAFSALVTTGRERRPGGARPGLPPRVRVERFVPQADVLRRAAAVVSHGGSGTTLGALAHGLPLVLVPQAADQFDNAARAVAAGAAIVLRPDEVTAESVRAARRARPRGAVVRGGGRRGSQPRSRRWGRPDEVGRRGRGVRRPAARLAACPRAPAPRSLVAVPRRARGGPGRRRRSRGLRRRGRVPAADDRGQPQPRAGFPPLALSLGVRDDAEARQLRRAAELYEAGRARRSRARIFARSDSLEAKLGAAFAAWPASDDRIEQLGALYPRSALVQLHVGLARFWAGTGGALTRLARGARRRARHAVRGARGRPDPPETSRPGCPSSRRASPTGSRATRPPSSSQRSQADESVRGRLLYGIALQRLGRPVSARRAFAEALQLAPDDVDAARRRRGRPLRRRATRAPRSPGSAR